MSTACRESKYEALERASESLAEEVTREEFDALVLDVRALARSMTDSGTEIDKRLSALEAKINELMGYA